MTWTNAQKKYAKSAKGRASRQKYQSSEKGKASRAAYLARRKAKLAGKEQSDAIAQEEPQIEQDIAESTIDLVEKKEEVVKIKKAP